MPKPPSKQVNKKMKIIIIIIIKRTDGHWCPGSLHGYYPVVPMRTQALTLTATGAP